MLCDLSLQSSVDRMLRVAPPPPQHPLSAFHFLNDRTTISSCGSTSFPLLFFTIPLSVRLLESRSRTRTTKLLRLTTSVVGYQESSIVLHERTLQLVFTKFGDVFLVVGYDGFCDGLSDSVDLGCVATASDTDTDVNASELFWAED